MSTNTFSKRAMSFRWSAGFTLFAGLFGLALQILPDMQLMAFFLSISALGGLMGDRRAYSEMDQQRLAHSLEAAFLWLLMAIFAAYAFILWMNWMHVAGAAVNFLNIHWPALMVSTMCILAGIAGLTRK